MSHDLCRYWHCQLNHFASVLSSDCKVLVEPFKFTNDNDGFCKLLAVLNSYDKSSLIIGLESTAHYGNNLVEFLVKRQFQVAVINPIRTSSMRKNRIRKTKTDKVETTIIAQTLMRQPYRLFSKYDIELMQLKTLGRFRQSWFLLCIWLILPAFLLKPPKATTRKKKPKS